eukprot:gene8897-3780_t
MLLRSTPLASPSHCPHVTPKSVSSRPRALTCSIYKKKVTPVALDLSPATDSAKSKADSSPSTSSSDASTSSHSSESNLTSAATLLAEVVASPLFYAVAGAVAIKLVASTGEQSASVFIFAATPIVALTLLSKSDLGKKVQASLNERLPELEAEAAVLKTKQAGARSNSTWYGPNRNRLPGPLGAAPHLKGEVAGDFGFDPLGLGTEAETFARYNEAEVLHGRWAMLAAVGALIPEVLSVNGVDLGEPVWWKVGAAKLSDENLTLNWGGIEGFRIAGKQGIPIIAACQLVLMGGPEYARYVGIKSLEPVGVFLPGEPLYPGGPPFDPLGLSENAPEFVEQGVKEAKNGRLAMVAMLGYFVQGAVTQEGPVRNLLDFIEDPTHNNITKYL